jgi:3-ketosteroid 9alpha-monooxygenase subunit B
VNTTFNAIVSEVVTETPDTKTLVLDLGATATYRAGQYVTIDPHQFSGLAPFVGYLEHLKGRREAPRAYSMCSDPSEPLAITIKEEFYEAGRTPYPPLISGFLVHQVRAGDRMAVVGFAGAYVFPEDVESRADHILHLCAGSGSVPNFSMIKDSLRRHRKLRHTLLYSNKTWDDVIFRDQLTQMSADYPSRLRVVHSLTRQTSPVPANADVRTGRIGRDLLAATLAAEPTSLVYACGPAVSVWEKRDSSARGLPAPAPRFLETMLAELEALGLPRSRLKIEAFG